MRGLVSDILGAFGITADIASTSAVALADPTSANIQAVVNAYAQNGQVVPGKLLAYLVEQNEARYPNDLYRATFTPWIVLGIGAALFIFATISRGRK